MKPREPEQDRTAERGQGTVYTRTLARRLACWFPHFARRFVRLAASYWRVLLLLVGILVQVVLTVLMWQLVDLCIALMEVWAELARKHLELTLS